MLSSHEALCELLSTCNISGLSLLYADKWGDCHIESRFWDRQSVIFCLVTHMSEFWKVIGLVNA